MGQPDGDWMSPYPKQSPPAWATQQALRGWRRLSRPEVSRGRRAGAGWRPDPNKPPPPGPALSRRRPASRLEDGFNRRKRTWGSLTATKSRPTPNKAHLRGLVLSQRRPASRLEGGFNRRFPRENPL